MQDLHNSRVYCAVIMKQVVKCVEGMREEFLRLRHRTSAIPHTQLEGPVTSPLRLVVMSNSTEDLFESLAQTFCDGSGHTHCLLNTFLITPAVGLFLFMIPFVYQWCEADTGATRTSCHIFIIMCFCTCFGAA